MEFPNLLWAISQLGARYHFASRIGVSEAWLSRRLLGRAQFSAKDRTKVADALGYPASWLFRRPMPPARAEPERKDATVASTQQ